MISNHESKANSILDLYDKAAELLKSADSFLKDHSETEKHNIGSVLEQIRSEWTSYELQANLFPKHMWERANAVFTELPKSENELHSGIKRLYEEIKGIVGSRLQNEINSYSYVSKTLAERIFNIYENESHTGQILQLLFDCCQKCAATAPQESYDHSIKLLEEFPDLLSGNRSVHPGYVYSSSHKQRVFEKCPVCGGESEPYYSAFSYCMTDFDHPFEPFKLWKKCKGCGNLHTWKFPEEFLALSSHEKVVTPSEDAQFKSLDGNTFMLPIWSNILNKLKAYNSKRSLLEVGIGHGELLSVALEMGYEISAVEIVEEEAQNVSDVLNIPIRNGDFLNFRSDKTFPVIIMGDVIEHVTDPEAALRNAYSLLDDDGVMWLSTPNFESSFTRLKKFTDPMWMEPYHITYFNYNGFEALLEKCGFSVREYTVSNRYNGSMELIITKKH